VHALTRLSAANGVAEGAKIGPVRLRRENAGLGSPKSLIGHHEVRMCSTVGVRFDRDYLHREMSRLLAEPHLGYLTAWA
jgi:hypothetical protein